eukprot:4664311-Pleurochrysis_carterae.AAC.2
MVPERWLLANSKCSSAVSFPRLLGRVPSMHVFPFGKHITLSVVRCGSRFAGSGPDMLLYEMSMAGCMPSAFGGGSAGRLPENRLCCSHDTVAGQCLRPPLSMLSCVAIHQSRQAGVEQHKRRNGFASRTTKGLQALLISSAALNEKQESNWTCKRPELNGAEAEQIQRNDDAREGCPVFVSRDPSYGHHAIRARKQNRDREREGYARVDDLHIEKSQRRQASRQDSGETRVRGRHVAQSAFELENAQRPHHEYGQERAIERARNESWHYFEGWPLCAHLERDAMLAGKLPLRRV